MRIAIATDAWFPQVNGVVRTLAATVAELDRRGFEVELITPDRFLTVPMPGYASIRLAVAPRMNVRRTLDAFAPDVVHVATEGPIGWCARGWAQARGRPFTSAFHTRFPDYMAVRTGLSADRFWPLMRRFHAPSRAVLCATPTLEEELASRGFANLRRWGRGIDHWTFRAHGDAHPDLANLPRPILLNVGRVSPEKNLEAFLGLACAGTKVVVGDGPALADLRARFPDVVFTGPLSGEDLGAAYRSADVFVFPSLTDTYGLVLIEALASGSPVAAFPVTGPLDIIGRDGRGMDGASARPIGALSADLGRAVEQALHLGRADAAAYAAQFTWQRATDQFIAALESALGGDWSAGLAARRLDPAAA